MYIVHKYMSFECRAGSAYNEHSMYLFMNFAICIKIWENNSDQRNYLVKILKSLKAKSKLYTYKQINCIHAYN